MTENHGPSFPSLPFHFAVPARLDWTHTALPGFFVFPSVILPVTCSFFFCTIPAKFLVSWASTNQVTSQSDGLWLDTTDRGPSQALPTARVYQQFAVVCRRSIDVDVNGHYNSWLGEPARQIGVLCGVFSTTVSKCQRFVISTSSIWRPWRVEIVHRSAPNFSAIWVN